MTPRADRPGGSFRNPRDRPLPIALGDAGHRALLSGRLRDAVEAHEGGGSTPRDAWRWFSDHVRHDHPLLEEPWPGDPGRYVSSVGGGLCDDNAVGLARLWAALGYHARVWQLADHVVPEVQWQGRWEMYDPDLDVYYLDDNARVASVAEIVLDPSLVTQPRMVLHRGRSAHSLMGRYSARTASSYGDCPPHLRSDVLDPLPSRTAFELPAGGSVELLPDPPADAMILIGARRADMILALTLPTGWEGDLRVPLVPHGIHGSGHLYVNGEPVVTSSAAGVAATLRRDIAGATLALHAHETMTVFFVANPHCFGEGTWVEDDHGLTLTRHPQPAVQPRSGTGEFAFDYPGLMTRVDTVRARGGGAFIDAFDREARARAVALADGGSEAELLLAELARESAHREVHPGDLQLTPAVLSSIVLAAEHGHGDRLLEYLEWGHTAPG